MSLFFNAFANVGLAAAQVLVQKKAQQQMSSAPQGEEGCAPCAANGYANQLFGGIAKRPKKRVAKR